MRLVRAGCSWFQIIASQGPFATSTLPSYAKKSTSRERTCSYIFAAAPSSTPDATHLPARPFMRGSSSVRRRCCSVLLGRVTCTYVHASRRPRLSSPHAWERRGQAPMQIAAAERKPACQSAITYFLRIRVRSNHDVISGFLTQSVHV